MVHRRQLSAFDLGLLAVTLTTLSTLVVWLEQRSSYQETQQRRLHLQIQGQSHQQSFKILQLADLHFGEASDTDWGPQQDINSLNVLDSVIPLEQPDLIILSGDQITANNIDQNATAVYRRICDKLQHYGVPWAMIFGNHDDAPLEVDDSQDETKIIVTPARTSREDLFHVDHSFAPLSLTRRGAESVFGVSNYVLDVFYNGSGTGNSHSNTVALQLLFLDSGGGTLPKQLLANQVDWFHQRRKHHQGIPMVAFQHIPTKEFEYDGNTCQGMQDDGVDALSPDANMVDALLNDGNVHFLAVGHQHGNDYCCSYQSSSSNNDNNDNGNNLHLCFGRHSGYGGYGSWDRGARVYELYLNNNNVAGVTGGGEEESDADEEQEPTFTWNSWVRMESGDVQDEYNPFGNGQDDDAEYRLR
ncbi:inactive purple acid phosphatase 16 [Seminavis robusta]|uniref:Inactive purple acid phosphatase 16 n=1 Tax=Seminavis robusta TaxID=568900 RepID=A0A9N8DEI5_9STRA|nr:inactive purple acid phosphatase 16 [Seminavis robusta]|eukprot:Sro56_g033030.1 inactive purple acid phosphatase 16 (415) ;mRNA; f:131576-132915